MNMNLEHVSTTKQKSSEMVTYGIGNPKQEIPPSTDAAGPTPYN